MAGGPEGRAARAARQGRLAGIREWLSAESRGQIEKLLLEQVFNDPALRAFHALAEKEWKKVPARGPKDAEARMHTSYYRMTSILESLARQAGDVDALVAIKSRDLTSPYRFLEIAEILAQTGRRDGALAWAERGHEMFSERPDSRLIEFLAQEYGRRGRPARQSPRARLGGIHAPSRAGFL